MSRSPNTGAQRRNAETGNPKREQNWLSPHDLTPLVNSKRNQHRFQSTYRQFPSLGQSPFIGENGYFLVRLATRLSRWSLHSIPPKTLHR